MISCKLLSINSILGIYMLIGSLKVSIKIIRATKDIIKTIIIFKTPIFFIFLFSIISFFLNEVSNSLIWEIFVWIGSIFSSSIFFNWGAIVISSVLSSIFCL